MPSALNVLLIIACSYTLAQITWLILSDEQGLQTIPTQTQSIGKPSDNNAEQQKIQQLSQAHLFGNYQSDTSKPVVSNAPETRLNLVLKGVLAADQMDNASAIIALGVSGKENTYGIGDRVSSATLKEIHADHVILERNGRFEALRLPKEFSKNTLIKSSSGMRSSKPSTPGQMLSDIRKKIIRNPTSFGQYAIPVPYNENGKLKGYRLQPQGDRSLFDAVGLDPNDVIVGINGIKLNKPTRGLNALRQLQNAKQVNITVLRNGREIPLSFEIP